MKVQVTRKCPGSEQHHSECFQTLETAGSTQEAINTFKNCSLQMSFLHVLHQGLLEDGDKKGYGSQLHTTRMFKWFGLVFFFPKPMVRMDWGKHNPHYTLCPMWGLVASLCCYKCHCWRVRNLTTTKNPKHPGIAIPHHKVTVSSMQYSLLFTFLHFWFASVRFNAGSMWRGRNPSHRTPEIAYSAVSQ